MLRRPKPFVQRMAGGGILTGCECARRWMQPVACRGTGWWRSHESRPVQRTIENKGSDTLVNLALAWVEAYALGKPAVRISVTGGGSGTGIAAMINGTVDIANASREIKPEEMKAATANGIDAEQFVVARDAIAVVVHPTIRWISSPCSSSRISTPARSPTGARWGARDRPIVLLSRESNSGTYAYFLENVVRLGKKSDLLFSPIRC